MKQYIRLLVLVVIAFATLISCKDNNESDTLLTGTDEEYKKVLENFVECTIKPTYRALAEAALVMRTANEALKANPVNATMKAASDAWMDARVKWEISEAFLFGPVGEQALDIDGHIDSWPLELEDVKREIDKGTITGRQAWQKEGEVIGFHVTEYLLYREGTTRPVSDLTANEMSYLIAATEALVWDCVLAYVAWVGINDLPTEMKEVFQENPDVIAHLDNNPNYKNFASRLTNAIGYSSMAAAMSEIASGAAEIAGEVGATKIAEPYDERNTNKVESWYSWHSLDDYTNNIMSIKNAYLGGINDDSRTAVSLSTYIASKDKSLDKEIKEKIEDCIDKIKAIGNNGQYSFYEVVRDHINETQVEAAETACNELKLLFEYIRDNIQ
jgi:uncharacterized iron-regulated protein